jgi:hypothetical protein
MTTSKKVTSPDFTELFQSIEDSLDLKDIKIHILVFGPELGHKNPGSKLRKHIVKKCK